MRFLASVSLLLLTTKLVSAQSLIVDAIDFDVEPGDGAEPYLVALADTTGTPRLPPSLSDRPRARAAVPAGPGRPAPSIILGLIAPETRAALGLTSPEEQEMEDAVFAYDDLEARRALRVSSPELFTRIVAGGLTDPPEDKLVRWLQTELERMNCYKGGVDGDWGGGSMRGVDQYFNQIVQKAPTRNATVDLYRAIVLNGDVECPEVKKTVVKKAKVNSKKVNKTPTRKKTVTQVTKKPKKKTVVTKPKKKTNKVKNALAVGNTF